MTEAQDTPQEGQEPTPEPKEGQEPQGEPKGDPKTFDADYVKTLRAEAAKHRKDAQEAKAKVTEYEEKDQSESEKLTGKLTKAEQERDTAKDALLRFRVAAEKKLPAELIDRLQGSSEEELAADADKLLELVQAQEKTPEFDGGAREPAPEPKTPAEEHNELAVALFGQPHQ